MAVYICFWLCSNHREQCVSDSSASRQCHTGRIDEARSLYLINSQKPLMPTRTYNEPALCRIRLVCSTTCRTFGTCSAAAERRVTKSRASSWIYLFLHGFLLNKVVDAPLKAESNISHNHRLGLLLLPLSHCTPPVSLAFRRSSPLLSWVRVLEEVEVGQQKQMASYLVLEGMNLTQLRACGTFRLHLGMSREQ